MHMPVGAGAYCSAVDRRLSGMSGNAQHTQNRPFLVRSASHGVLSATTLNIPIPIKYRTSGPSSHWHPPRNFRHLASPLRHTNPLAPLRHHRPHRLLTLMMRAPIKYPSTQRRTRKSSPSCAGDSLCSTSLAHQLAPAELHSFCVATCSPAHENTLCMGRCHSRRCRS